LLEIVARRRERLADVALGVPDSGGRRGPASIDHPFLAALRGPQRSVIAEVKLGSPRLGDLRDEVEPEALAEAYARSGAAALSVVVEPDFFFGGYELLESCARASGLPALAKDFIVDRVQLEWAARAGAGAVLLIAALYEIDELATWASEVRRLGMVPLIETHDEADLERLVGASWELVGINNRDLRTFQVDLERSLRLVERLPDGCVAVAESGLRTAHDLERLGAAGFDAFLIGEALVTADDPGRRLRVLLGRGHE
jgi:indole-3-glycerol phosphate synthase